MQVEIMSDGTPANTRVKVGDSELTLVKSLQVDLRAGEPAMATIECMCPVCFLRIDGGITWDGLDVLTKVQLEDLKRQVDSLLD